MDSSDLSVDRIDSVGLMEIRRPPHNYFDTALVRDIALAVQAFDEDPEVRVTVLCSEGKSFCAGASFTSSTSKASDGKRPTARDLYKEAVRLMRRRKPMVAAVHGAAVGGGLGLACAADFRVTCAEARFSANFVRLGLHPGFGLTVLLPELIGKNEAELLFYTGRRIGGEEALRIGLANLCVPQDKVRAEAIALAREIAAAAPLAVASTRETVRGDLADRIEAALERELSEQTWLRKTEDFQEGVRASAERREPSWTGR